MDIKKITHDAERAIQYLSNSEEKYARYKGLDKVQHERQKIALARIMGDSPEKSAAGKKAWAEASEEYERIIDESQEIHQEYTLVHARRQRAEYNIEIWRSLNSAQKRGNI